MVNLRVKAKKIVRELPYPVGRFIAHIPFDIVFGKRFNQFKKEFKTFSTFDDKLKRAYYFHKIKNIVSHSYKNNKFYNDFYTRNNFHPDQLKSFGDISKIPILKKNDLLKYTFDKRANSDNASDKINTGGTTGEPLEFYIENNALAREWAHMLHIWSKLDYERTDLKLNFRGINIGQNVIKYNAPGNEYIVNAYAENSRVADVLESLLQRKTIYYLHGYPSAIYEFTKYIHQNRPALLQQLNKTLKGILLGSEFPAPIYRDLIDEVFSCRNISWYGHSEMCILAYEKNEKYKYEPMGSYGYCEAVSKGQNSYRLIGTSFYNTASPFIRYDTGDLVSPIQQENGLLKSFSIEEGRVGEFIIDKNGQHVSLTALIFGRHHSVFGQAKFIQVRQSKKGEARILITHGETEQLSSYQARANFDAKNVNIDFTFEIIDEPYRTKAGKIPLLIKRPNSRQ